MDIQRLQPRQTPLPVQWTELLKKTNLRAEDTPEVTVLVWDGDTLAATGSRSGTLLQYLNMKLAGDPQASRMWLGGQEAPLDLSAYQGVVPLRFAPLQVPQHFDDRAGLVRRIAPNAAVIDAAMAATASAGKGRRLIESIRIFPT